MNWRIQGAPRYPTRKSTTIWRMTSTRSPHTCLCCWLPATAVRLLEGLWGDFVCWVFYLKHSAALDIQAWRLDSEGFLTESTDRDQKLCLHVHNLPPAFSFSFLFILAFPCRSIEISRVSSNEVQVVTNYIYLSFSRRTNCHQNLKTIVFFITILYFALL